MFVIEYIPGNPQLCCKDVIAAGKSSVAPQFASEEIKLIHHSGLSFLVLGLTLVMFP